MSAKAKLDIRRFAGSARSNGNRNTAIIVSEFPARENSDQRVRKARYTILVACDSSGETERVDRREVMLEGEERLDDIVVAIMG